MTDFTPSQQYFRDRALESMKLQDWGAAQTFALLAIGEALISGYSGLSMTELVEKMGMT